MAKSSDPSRPIPPPRAYHKGNVADDLRKAAERILATEPLEAITVRRLAKEVGVAPANFYNHFDNLNELLFGIAASSLDQAVDRAIAIWSRPGSKADLLIASATDFIRFCLKNKQFMRLMLSQRGGDRGHQRDEAASRSFTEIVRFIYGDRIAPPPPASDREEYGVAVGYIALTYGFALILAEGRFDLDAENDAELSRFVRNGILPFLDGSAAGILSADP